MLAAIVALIAAFVAFDLGRYITLDYFKSQQAAIDAFYQANPLKTAALFFAAYVAVTGLSLPGAAIMTLAAGAIFGLAWGTVIVSFASSLGATLAFLTSRFVLRDSIQSKFGDKLAAINAGIDGIPRERVRLHICGNTTDKLESIAETGAAATVPASNPRSASAIATTPASSPVSSASAPNGGKPSARRRSISASATSAGCPRTSARTTS